MINLSQTTHSVYSTVDFLLDRGASQLYDKYLNNKLPQHTHKQNNSTFYNNLSLNEVIQPKRDVINSSPITIIQQVPIDTLAPKHLLVRKDIDGYSTLSPKNTTFGKSTKYQTIIQSQKSSIQKQKDVRNISDSMIFQQQNETELPISIRKSRPMTMQTGRNNKNTLLLDSKLQEVEQKRAMTCHARKRKVISIIKDKQQNFFKLDQEIPVSLRDQVELTNRLRKYKKERQEQGNLKDSQNAKMDAYIQMREKRIKQNFLQLKCKLKGKNVETPAITNVQTQNGVVTINGKPKQLKTHIVHMLFNPQEEQIYRKMCPKVSGVNSTKKNSFSAKIKKKIKITNQQFTNNGGRQVSSIPFMNLNYGIVLSESTIQASASRRRPSQELTRQKFTITNQSQKFKSHNPLVNSARVKVYATIDQIGNQTAKSSFFQNTISDKKQFETTLDSRKQMSGSILWKARQKSDHKTIRVSNLEAFNQQIMQMKLAH